MAEAAKRLAEAEAWPSYDEPIYEQMERCIWAVDQAEAAGLDRLTVAWATDPFDAEVETAVAERLAQALLARKQPGMAPALLARKQPGMAPLSRALTNFLTASLIEKCAIPPALKQLVWQQLDAEHTGARRIGQPDAFNRAARYAQVYPMAGMREIAAHAGTNPDTVARWIRDGWKKVYRTKIDDKVV
jgi:hypothetical protein